jgi:uncharacterized surface protein with fasciclin (FAS1) repeats
MGFDKTEDLFKSEPLMDALLGYALLPAVYSADQLAKFAPFTVKPFTGGVLRLKAPAARGGNVVVNGGHNSATVVKAGLDAGRSVVHAVDAVLMPETVFFTIMEALEYYSSTSILQNLVDMTNQLDKSVNDPKTSLTLFAPRNEAFLALGPSFIARAEAAADGRLQGLQYLMVPGGARFVPAGFKDGEVLPTLLKGESLTVNLTAVADPATKKRQGRMEVVPSGGRPAAVGLINVVAGRSVIHGVDAVLIPKSLEAE